MCGTWLESTSFERMEPLPCYVGKRARLQVHKDVGISKVVCGLVHSVHHRKMDAVTERPRTMVITTPRNGVASPLHGGTVGEVKDKCRDHGTGNWRTKRT